MNYYLLHITYPILFLSVFGRQLCLPVPALLFLHSAGAMACAGKLSFFGILMVAVLGCLLANLAWYETGRRRGQRVLRLLCALADDPRGIGGKQFAELWLNFRDQKLAT